MSVLIDERGRSWPAQSRQLAARMDRFGERDDRAILAVRWLGHIYLQQIERAVIVFFRPELVTLATLAGTFAAIVRLRPHRLVLSFGRQEQPPEIFSDVNEALRRVEALCNSSRLPSRKSGIISERLPLECIMSVSDGRARELLRVWSTASRSWSPELQGQLRGAGLLSQTLVVRTPVGTDTFIIEHWGSKRTLLGRQWARNARGRDLREQPYRELAQWAVATLRESLATRQPRLDGVHATVVTPRGAIHQRRYHRLLVPFRSPAGDMMSAVINVYEKPELLADRHAPLYKLSSRNSI